MGHEAIGAWVHSRRWLDEFDPATSIYDIAACYPHEQSAQEAFQDLASAVGCCQSPTDEPDVELEVEGAVVRPQGTRILISAAGETAALALYQASERLAISGSQPPACVCELPPRTADSEAPVPHCN